MKRLGLFALFVAAAACGPAPNLLPQDDLNRPTDVAFMCFGAFPSGTGTDAGVPDGGAGGPLTVSGRPMRACHPQAEYDPGPTSQTRTFAFLPNSAAGTLSVVDADHWKLVDLDLDTAGYGTAPLGQLPEQISVSDDGCRLLSANRGSCDLTLVDPSVLVAPVFSSQNGVDVMAKSPRTGSLTIRPIRGDGTPLLAAPYEAVFLPQDTTSLVTPAPSDTVPYLQGQGPLCGDGANVDPVNWSAPPIPNSWYALVTYPSCNLITLIALPSGRIVSSAQVSSPDGQTVVLTDTKTTPVCPLLPGDCVGQAIPPQPPSATSDAAAVDGVQHAPPPDASADAGVPDAAADAGGSPGTGGTTATGGMTGTGGATMGTGGATGRDAGATGGAPAGAFLGNQFPNDPFVGSPIGPSGIAIVPGGSRAYVSLANASYVLSIDLSSAGSSLTGNAIKLSEGARGSTRIRLNVDPTRILSFTPPVYTGVYAGDAPGWNAAVPDATHFAGHDLNRRYLYVIARDGTVRVVSVASPGFETECETNVDPVNLPPRFHASDPCIPIDPKDSYRRPYSVGPGIHFPSLPIDIAAVDLQHSATTAQQTIDTSEQSVNGAYAWVITDSGIVYLVNINPVLRDYTAVIPVPDPSSTIYGLGPKTEPFPFVNTLRDRNVISYALTLDPSSGPPRVDAPPPVPATGPYIEPFYTVGSARNATATSGSFLQTSVFFTEIPSSPDPNNPEIDRRAITAQTWTVAWEGALTGNRNSGNAFPIPRPGQSFGGFPSGATWDAIPGLDSPFEDGGGNYCQTGVVRGDMLTLTGCTSDNQCGIGEVCVNGDTSSSVTAGLAVTGICVDPNQQAAQMASCGEFLNSLRRYEIVGVSPSWVIMRPHLDEIVFSSLTKPCHAAISGKADGGAGNDAGGGADAGAGSADTCPDTLNDPTTANFKCVSEDPITGPAPRCLMRCTGSDTECRAGRVCVDFDPGPDPQNPRPKCSTGECFCADAPPFNDAGKQCFDQLVNYQVVAGKSFIVAGSQTGIVTTANLPSKDRPTDGTCDPHPTPDPRFSFRIPLNGPQCSNLPADVQRIDSRVDPDFASDPIGAAMDASKLVSVVTSTPEPSDPCLYLGGPISSDQMSGSAATAADGGVTPPPTHVRALFKNSQLSFVLANLDRGPTFQFSTQFDVHGGFAPQAVQSPTTIQISMPARIVVGPVDSQAQVTTGPSGLSFEAPYLFVVDQRRLGGGQGGGPTRGQLLRINPFLYQSTIGSAPTGYQPQFEDYNASGGLFPIQ